MNERDARWWLDHYGVHIGVLVVFALALFLAPSKGTTQNTAFDRAGSASTAPSSSGTGPATTIGPGGGPGGAAVGGGGSGAPSSPAGGAGGGGEAGPGGGVAGLGEDCSRTELLGARFGCMPLSDGSNAGATYTGVAADRVTIVVHNYKTDPQAEAVLGDAGYSNDPALVASQSRAYAEWLQAHFQTWGRAVDLKFLQSAATDPASFRAEAVKATQEMGAFMVVSNVYDVSFIDEVTRRGVICLCPGAFSDRGPLLWGWGFDDLVYNSHYAEYVCKKLAGNADYAGPGSAGKPRVYAFLHAQKDEPWIADFKTKLGQCGIVPREMAYAEDVTTAVQQATNMIQQAKSAGVTTILWPGAPYLAFYFGFKAATQQQYYPEWVTGADSYFETRFLPADQSSRMFGISRSTPSPNWAEAIGQAIYSQLRPGETYPRPGFAFSSLLLAFMALEKAGPTLDPATVEQGLFTVRLPASNAHEETVTFGPGDYGGMDDTAEIWWDPNKIAPDGKPGDFQYVNGGRRYTVGAWPATPAQPFKPECTAPGSCGEPG